MAPARLIRFEGTDLSSGPVVIIYSDFSLLQRGEAHYKRLDGFGASSFF